MAARLILGEGFERVCEVDLPAGYRARTIYKFFGRELQQDDYGRWYHYLDRLQKGVPGALAPYVERVEALVCFPTRPRRKEGKYADEDGQVTATLQTEDGKTYELFLSGANIDQVRALHGKIRRGEIQPTEDWSAETEPATESEHIGETLSQIFMALTSGEIAVPQELMNSLQTTNLLLAGIVGIVQGSSRGHMPSLDETRKALARYSEHVKATPTR